MASAEQDTEEALDAFQLFMRNRVAPNPSLRNPQFSRDVNYADRIEAQCQEDNHRTWGFVIYRTTYESDADWEEVICRIRAHTQGTMDMFNGQDVLDRMTWTIFDDRSLFDDVPTATIRKHFKEWCEGAVLAEQGITDPGKSSRYRYCLQVDYEAMRSILQAPTPPDYVPGDPGWLKLIVKDWLPFDENPRLAAARAPTYQRDTTVYEPIEGMTERHVGFVRCTITSVMLNIYIVFCDPTNFSVWERRPPDLVG
ncbi:hypothetical protein AMS68_002593 [Peltaster fructicola]|uniref:Uncharacterized protein n=1 Tax=Peltaster fructicola TaxID=286661 RepID=A0A6H0XQW1_9PEZI|nr:hypothetical protein AMS68_002593 [Peltaster fructicola]